MMSEDLTREEINKVLEAMPDEATTVGIAELVYNIIDGFHLDDEEFTTVILMILAARRGAINVQEFGPNGERDSHETH